MMAPLLFSLVLGVSSPAADIARSVTVAVHRGSDTTPECSGLLLDKTSVLTARHCVDHSAPSLYAVYNGKTKSRYAVESVTPYKDDTRHFPNFDVAKLELAAPVERRVAPVKIGKTAPRAEKKLWSLAYGKPASCPSPPCAPALEQTSLTAWKAIPQGRLKGLFATKATGRRGLCFGDSGAPVFRQTSRGLEVVGLVSGQIPAITGKPVSCQTKITLHTRLAPYASWVNGKEDVGDLEGRGPKLSSDLATHCEEETPASPSWHLTQTLLLEIGRHHGGIHNARVRKLLGHCKGTGALFQRFNEQRGELTLSQAIPLAAPPYVRKIRRLKVTVGRLADMKNLGRFSGLERLTVIAATDGLDLTPLAKLKHLETLTIKHAHSVTGLTQVVRRRDLRHVTLFNVTLTQGSARTLCSLSRHVDRLVIDHKEITECRDET